MSLSRLKLWLDAELGSRVLTDPPFASYAAAAEEVARELAAHPMPERLHEEARREAAGLLVAIMQVRLAKLMRELGQGAKPGRLAAEEERLAAAVAKVLEAAPGRRRGGDYVVVQFLDKFPAMTTSDFVMLGPFDRGDLAKLPAQDARELEEKGRARRFNFIVE